MLFLVFQIDGGHYHECIKQDAYRREYSHPALPLSLPFFKKEKASSFALTIKYIQYKPSPVLNLKTFIKCN